MSVPPLFRPKSDVCSRGAVQDNLIKMSRSAVIVPDKRIKSGLLNIWSLCSKAVLINELMSDTNKALFCLSECQEFGQRENIN